MENKGNLFSAKIERLVNVILAMERNPRYFGPACSLSTTQIHAIQIIGDQGETTMHGLASKLTLSKSTITQVVDALQRKKCIVRSRDTRDKRRAIVRLTAKGLAAYRVHEQWHHELTLVFLSRFDEAELRTLDLFLDDVITIFQSCLTESMHRSKEQRVE